MRAFLLVLVGLVAANAEPKNRPITKVVNLLNDMRDNLEKEAREDEEVYNKMSCWCKTNDRVKTKAIADAETKISQLSSQIEEFTATSARLTIEIKKHETEIRQLEAGLDKATNIRREERASFTAEEKDALQAIASLKNAITVLSKHNNPPKASLVNIATVLKGMSFHHASWLSDSQLKTISAFVQAPGEFFDSKPIFKQSYAPQSGEIFGILGNMKDTFEANLSQSQKDEQSAQAVFEELKMTKTEQIADAKKILASKQTLKAQTDDDNASAQEDKLDTEDSLSADQKYLMDLKEKCSATDAEWDQRQHTRAEEIKAVSEAITILSGDDARDLATSTFNPSFMQFNNRETAAAQLLRRVATKTNSQAMSQLAARVGLDSFQRVKAAIDEMITSLLKEKDDEIKHKDFCNKEFNSNDQETTLKKNQHNKLESEIDNLKVQIKTLTEEIEATQTQMDELKVQIKRGGEIREKENLDFQAVVKDQRATKLMLNNALDKLKGFYQKKAKAFLQQQPVGPASPAGFKSYSNQSGAGGVMSLIEQVIADTKVAEAEAVAAEKDAQVTYEAFVRDSNDDISAKTQTVVDKTKRKADKETELSQKKDDLSTTQDEIEQLSTYAASLHKSCDFVIKNFDIRQTARDEEVEGLRQAKSILSGADFQ